MPTKLWLECLCDATEFGDELVAVGGDPALGSWLPEAGAVLVTSQALFPRWRLKAPLVLADVRPYCRWLEYKYLIRSRDGSWRWEEFGMERRICYDFDEPILISEVINRRMEAAEGHLLLRLDRFGQDAGPDEAAPLAEAAWRLPPGWDPLRAGQGAMLGRCCFMRGPPEAPPQRGVCWAQPERHELRQLDRHCPGDLGAPPAAQPAAEPGLPPEWGPGTSLMVIAAHAFAEPGHLQLLDALRQLRRQRRLPVGLWMCIAAYLDGDLELPKRVAAARFLA
mmetsp:Transcript_94787/g.306016  ORF Transcript_94787/g.306016 Transcript_94787/m.306016 type:complete len:280 (-) Transcript_94787:172-1011(-)